MGNKRPTAPDGWNVYGTVDGWGATKRFDDHYKTVEVHESGDLFGACRGVDLEAGLRVEGEKNQAAAVAEDLRAQADAIDPSSIPVTEFAWPVTDHATVPPDSLTKRKDASG